MTDHHVLSRDGSFEAMRLGRLPARRDPRTLQMAKYIDQSALPPIPTKLPPPPVESWPMYGNADLGDCTIAAAGHLIQAWTTDGGHPAVPADAEIEAAYWETGDPPAATGTSGGPTDVGRVELDVLNYWRNTGIAGDKITAYVAVNPRVHGDVCAANYLFGGVYLGVALPISAQGQTRWDVTDGPDAEAGSWGGHAVPVVGYDAACVTVVTWGGLMEASWAFVSRYVDEAYAILSRDALTEHGVSSHGFDADALTADLAEIARES